MAAVSFCSGQGVEIDAPDTSPEHSLVTVKLNTKCVTCNIAVMRLLNQSVQEVKVVKVDSSHSYVFTGPQGKYRIDAVICVTETGLQRGSKTITIEGDSTPDPIDPIEPIDPKPSGLAGAIYDSVNTYVDMPREEEAIKIANVFKTVAGRAAGLQLSPQEMVKMTGDSITKVLGDRRGRWDQWKNEFSKILRAQKLPATRDAHVEAWKEIARGLEAVRDET